MHADRFAATWPMPDARRKIEKLLSEATPRRGLVPLWIAPRDLGVAKVFSPPPPPPPLPPPPSAAAAALPRRRRRRRRRRRVE
jgi:hypothetical protein